MADRATSSAAALTYTSLLALVPLTTISFAIFSAFPAFGELKSQVEAWLFSSMVPEVGGEISSYINQFNSKASSMTAIGIIGIAVSAILVLFTIEGAFNAIWRVKRPRPIFWRIVIFWAVLTILPIFLALSLSFSVRMNDILANIGDYPIIRHLVKLIPFIFLSLALSVLYVFIPNRPVYWRNALVGGAIAAALIIILKNGFSWYIHNFPSYENIYGALATIPIFLIWLYIMWTAILAGAIITAARPEWLSGYAYELLPNADLSEQALTGKYLAIAIELLDHLYIAGNKGIPIKRRQLEHRMSITGPRLDEVQTRLKSQNWISLADNDRWVISRDLAELTLYDLMRALGLGLGQISNSNSKCKPSKNTDCWRKKYNNLIKNADNTEKETLGLSIKQIITAKN